MKASPGPTWTRVLSAKPLRSTESKILSQKENHYDDCSPNTQETGTRGSSVLGQARHRNSRIARATQQDSVSQNTRQAGEL